ncbi:high-affinity branched-chain amino acid ABC transporter permease LivM [Pararoseomonas indoligenes]|uniref:high-affinity branched-chain amino acid ABC transporter permease LivM n=1 Tax=Roseomonas indoligenes TaxID=2820811 RepID=UPI0024737409|nr:high-affinity branched-chain amino acid ABC transporter permease LivM [Pararoseomonas indoligenes]
MSDSVIGGPHEGGAARSDDGVPGPGQNGGIPRGPAQAAPRPPIAHAVRDAVMAALVSVVLFVPLVGLRTDVSPGSGLIIRTRWADVAILVGLVFVGRLVLNLWQDQRPARRAPTARRTETLRRIGTFVAPLLLGFAIVLPFLPGTSRYVLDLGILVLTYVMLGWGLNIVVGLAGLLDLGYVAFYAVGAYAYALLSTNFGLSFWICLPLAGIMAAFWGVILGFPVLRLRGDYLAIVTLAFGEIIRVVLINWVSLTGGPNGISGIPRPSFFGLNFTAGGGPGSFADFFGLEPSPTHRVVFLYYLILVLALLTNWVTLRLRRQPLGRAWEALREDEIACRALGINVTNTKLTAFAIGAMFGGFAGAFFATRQAFVSPESFTFIESAIILAIVVLGGLGSQLGVALAALVMIGGFEAFRDLEEYRMLVFGGAMVAIMVWRPRGLVSTRTPSIALGKRRAISGDLVGEGQG